MSWQKSGRSWQNPGTILSTSYATPGLVIGMHVLRQVRKLNHAAVFVLLLLVASVSGRSQPGMRNLTGSVTDKRGNTLPGAVVQLENTVNLSVMSYITAKDGRYHFNGLSDDVNYTVRAKYRKWWSSQKRLSKLDSSPRPKIDLMIPID